MHVYGNIVMKGCVEKDLTRRQLAIKDSTSKSWFVALREILCKTKYGLSFFLYCNTPLRGLRAGEMRLKATVQKVYAKRNE